MPSEPAKPRPTKRRRGRRVVVILLAMLAVGLGTVVWLYRHYTDPERIRQLAESRLQHYVGGRVSVGGARFSWVEGVCLSDVAVFAADAAGKGTHATSDAVFTCREVRLQHDTKAALSGGLVIKNVTAVEPTCSIVRNTDDGSINLENLLLAAPPPMDQAPPSWPTIELRSARVHVVSRTAGRDRVVDDLSVTVRAKPTKHDSQLYDVTWQGGDPRAPSGHSRIDLRTGRIQNVQGGLPWMSVEAVAVAINTRYDGVSAWHDLLGLEGTVRAQDYSVGEGDGGAGPSATIALSEATISIPINAAERRVQPAERYLRFQRVDGQVRLTRDTIVAEFSGLFHNSECKVELTIRADGSKLESLADVSFDAALSAKALTLPRRDRQAAPAEARFVDATMALATLYRLYDPVGVIDLDIRAAKNAGADQPIRVDHATVTAIDGSASALFFPYRVDGVRGVIDYSSEGIFLRDIVGHRGEGTLTVDGWVASPQHMSEKKVTVVGKNLALDDALWGALESRHRRIRDQFLPTGTIDLTLDITQRSGTDAEPSAPTAAATVSLRGVSASYFGFPYPVTDLTGTLRIDTLRVEVNGLVGRSADATIRVDGAIDLVEGGTDTVDLTIRGEDVAFDESLMAALPPEASEQVNRFHPAGTFDVATTVSCTPQQPRTTHVSHVMLNDVSLRPDALPIDLTEVLGQLRIASDEILVEGVTGRYKNATFSVEGSFAGRGEERTTSLMIRASDLALDDSLRAALPEKTREALSAWRVDGPIATETAIHASAGVPVTSRTIATLNGVSVHHLAFPTPFDDVHAVVDFDQEAIQVKDVRARYGTGTVRLDFEGTAVDGEESGTIGLSATNLTLDTSLRGLLPDSMARAWDRMKPAGTADLYLEQLRYHRSTPDARREWTVRGYAELGGVALGGVADVQRASGTLVGAGAIVDPDGGTSLTGSLSLASLDLYGRRVTNATSSWSLARLANGEGMLALRSNTGRIYDGSLAGDLDIEFDPRKTDYRLSVTAQDVQLGPVVNAPRSSSPNTPPIDVSGLLGGQLQLTGTIGASASRRGTGRFEVREGHIYRMPIILAILNVLNFTMPGDGVFEQARANFLISGDRTLFNDIRIEGSALALAGSGSMSLPDQSVDLGLVSVNPRQRLPWDEVINGISRELVELHVTGPLSQPTVRPEPFPGIAGEFRRLFQKKRIKNIQPSSP